MGSEGRTRLALFGLLAATLLGFGQVLAGSDYWGPAMLGMLAAIALAAGTRRIGAGTAATIVASVVVLVGYLAFIFRSAATLYGIPTAAAVGGLRRSVFSALQFSKVDYAPVPARAGYVIMTVAGMWILATFAEVATFRWRRPILAGLPAIVLFAALMVLGTGEGAGFVIALWLAALLTYWGVESSHRLRSWGRWVSAWAQSPGEPAAATAGTARRMSAVCIAAALISPMFFPAPQDGLLSWRNKTGDGLGGRRALNPLVSLLPRLLEPGDEERFRVVTDGPTYYRVVTLAEFDGTDWRPADPPDVEVGDDPGRTLPLDPDVRPEAAVFNLSGLAGDRLPTPQGWERISLLGAESRSGDLLTDFDTRDLRLAGGIPEGLEYSVTVRDPGYTYRHLRDADVEHHSNTAYTQNPNLSPKVLDLLRDWTATADSPFEKLVAIQSRFRADFTYSLDVKASASRDYLTLFLTESKAGYCQQFATAFALLARALGYPARVVAGYLPGVPDPNVRNTYVIGDFEAHAWPEVHFQGIGWVRFEPTPRSDVSVRRPAYTSPAGGGTGADDPGLAGPGGSGDDGGLSAAARELIRPRIPREQPGGALPDLAAPPEPRWQGTFARVAGAIGLAFVVFAVVVPLLKRLLVRGRYRRARSHSDVATAAFAEFEFEATELANPRRASESAVSYARRITTMQRVSGTAALELAHIYEAALFGPSGVDAHQAREARRLARSLSSLLWKSASWWERAQRLFSPRALRPDRLPT